MKGWIRSIEFRYAAVVTLGDPALYIAASVLNWPHITIFTAVGPVRKALSVYTGCLVYRCAGGRDGLVEYHDHFTVFKHRRLQAGQ